MLKEKNNFQTKHQIRKQSIRIRKLLGVYKYYRSYSAMKNFIQNFDVNLLKSVGCYWPINSEIDTRPLITYLIKKKISVALPIIIDHKMLFKLWKPKDKLYYSRYSFYAPCPKLKTITPDIIITPALALDYNGNRVGYGKGFYDKYYNNNQSKIYVGYNYNELSFKALPFEKHDLKLNAIVTDAFVKIIEVKI